MPATELRGNQCVLFAATAAPEAKVRHIFGEWILFLLCEQGTEESEELTLNAPNSSPLDRLNWEGEQGPPHKLSKSEPDASQAPKPSVLWASILACKGLNKQQHLSTNSNLHP